MTITELRTEYHRRVCREIITTVKATKKGQEVQYPSFADGDSKASVRIAWGIEGRDSDPGFRTQTHLDRSIGQSLGALLAGRS
jgi:hypothetical protein